MSLNVISVEGYFPVPGVTHADETVDGSVGTLAALNSRTRLVMVSVTADITASFDGVDPAVGGHGHVYSVGDVIHMNEVMAVAMKWISAGTGIMAVTELERI
jgi:hypothetical protein